MKKIFECNVILEHDINVIIDDNTINDEFLEIHAEVFGGCDTLEDHAEHIAWFVAEYGIRDIEGYGFPIFRRKIHDGSVHELYKDKWTQKGIIVELVDIVKSVNGHSV